MIDNGFISCIYSDFKNIVTLLKMRCSIFSEICLLQFLKCEDFLSFAILYSSKSDIVGFRQFLDILRHLKTSFGTLSLITSHRWMGLSKE